MNYVGQNLVNMTSEKSSSNTSLIQSLSKRKKNLNIFVAEKHAKYIKIFFMSNKFENIPKK